MRVLITGGRYYRDEEFVHTVLSQIPVDEIIHANCNGADLIADLWAWSNNVKITVYKSCWKKYGVLAPVIRNEYMITDSKPDLLIAFPGNEGTQNMIKLARKHNLKLIDYNLSEEHQ